MSGYEDACKLSPELAALAEKNYGETDTKRREYLAKMRSILEAKPSEDRLKDLSDKNLIRFLRCRKFDVDRAVEMAVKAKHFYVKHADLLKGLNGKEIDDIFSDENESFWQIYRDVDKAGRAIIVLRPFRLLSNIKSMEMVSAESNTMLRFLIFLFHHVVMDPQVQVGGLIFLNSFRECTFWQCINFANIMTIEQRKIFIQHLQLCGIRIKGMYIFEEPMVITTVFFIVKQFMSEKIRNRINFCGAEYSVINEVVEGPIDSLPLLFAGQKDDSRSDDACSRRSVGAVHKPDFTFFDDEGKVVK